VRRTVTRKRRPTVAGFTIDVLTGLSMMSMVSQDLGDRAVLLHRWRRTLGILLGELDASTLLDEPKS